MGGVLNDPPSVSASADASTAAATATAAVAGQRRTVFGAGVSSSFRTAASPGGRANPPAVQPGQVLPRGSLLDLSV